MANVKSLYYVRPLSEGEREGERDREGEREREKLLM